MAELPIATRRGTGAPAAPRLDSGFRRNDEVGGRNDVSGCGNDGRDAANDGSGCGNDDEMLIRRSIPDRSPGHAFIAIAHAGCHRHTKV